MVESHRLKEQQCFNISGNIKPVFCTMKKTVDFCAIEKINKYGDKYFKWPTLGELYKKLFNEQPKGCHNAMADVLICLRCYMKFKFNRDLLIDSSDKLKEMYNSYCQ